MTDLMYCLINLLFFDIALLYYYTNLNSSIICSLFSGDIYVFIGFSISFSFCERDSLVNFLESLVVLSAILLPIKSPVASSVFWIAVFETVFIVLVVDFLAVSRRFWLSYCLCFSKDKNWYSFTYILSLGSI